jgi:hypothetical protein
MYSICYPNNNFSPFSNNSMFLQNMMVVSPDTTVTYIARSRAREELRNDRPNRRFLSVLLTAIRETLHDVDFVSCTFGFLAVVALDTKGGASLAYLDAETLAMDAIREHPDSPQLHEVAFALLKNMDAEAVVDFPSDGYEEFVQSVFD